MLCKMAYDGIDINEFKNTSDNWQDNYICDIRPMASKKGIYEVFKYCFKDIDIKNIEVFKNLCFGLKGKRIRQGYGSLYKLKIDDKDLTDVKLTGDDIKNYLQFKNELPVIILSNYAPGHIWRKRVAPNYYFFYYNRGFERHKSTRSAINAVPTHMTESAPPQ